MTDGVIDGGGGGGHQQLTMVVLVIDLVQGGLKSCPV